MEILKAIAGKTYAGNLRANSQMVVAFASLVALAATGVRAETYYHKGADTYGNSSFDRAQISSAIGWSTSPNGSVVSSIADWAGSDFIVSGSGNSIRLPTTDSDITFAGKSLTVSDSTIAFKRASNKTALTRNVTIADLRFTGPGGVLDHGESKADHGGSVATIFCIKGGISIADNAAMTLGQSFNGSNDQREFVIDSAVIGGEASAIAFRTSCSSSINNVSAVATFNSMAGFYGTFNVDSATTTPNLYLTVNGTFNGTVTSLPQNTQWVRFDFDGLPVGKGVRIKGANPGAAVTRLRLYSATADFTTPGLVVATFEDVSSVGVVENIGWNIQYSTSLDGTYSPLQLKAQVNGNGTISLVTTTSTYYKTGSDSGYNSSLPISSTLSSGWSKMPGGAAVTVAAGNIAASDFVVSGGNVLRICDSKTFGGASLKIVGPGDGSSCQLVLKTNGDNGNTTAVTTIGNLIFSGGAVMPAVNNAYFKIAGNMQIEAGRSFGIYPINAENSYALRRIEVVAPVTGGADTTIDLFKATSATTKANAGDMEVVFDDLENFEGVFNDNLPATTESADYVANASFIHFAGKFGGRIGTMHANAAKFVVNYDGLPAGKGLRAATTSIPAKFNSGTVFYSSDVTKFMTDGTVLATFPAGTVVEPTAFVFEYASSAAGERFAMPPCRTESGANGEVRLVIDIEAPAYAKMVKDAQTNEYAWHFYLAGDNGALGDDVTATCGKTVPDNSMVVLFAGHEEFAAISANPGTAREYHLTAFTCVEDVDFSTVAFASSIVADAGLSIDPAGHRVTVPVAFANTISTVTSATAGSEFCVTVASGSETLNGPVMSGTVKLVKAGAGTLFCFKADQTYTGGNKVEGGVLSAPKPPSSALHKPGGTVENNAENTLNMNSTDYNAAKHYFGAAGNDIIVADGAVFDVYGNYGYHIYRIVLDGGTLRNVDMNNVNEGQTDKNIHQNENGVGSGNILLTADSAMRFRSNIVLSDGTIDLGGHALDIHCSVGDKKVLLKCNATNGTIRLIKDGGDAAEGLKVTGSRPVDASTVTLIDEVGLRVATAFTVSNYTAKLDLAAKYWNNPPSGLYTGQAQMTILDTFRPEGRYFPGCTMAAGSTVDLRAWNFASWGAVKSLATDARNSGKVDFLGNVTIDLSGRSDLSELASAEGESGVKGTYLFTWGEEGGADKPDGKIFKLDAETSQHYQFRYDDVGLRFAKIHGLIIYVR